MQRSKKSGDASERGPSAWDLRTSRAKRWLAVGRTGQVPERREDVVRRCSLIREKRVCIVGAAVERRTHLRRVPVDGRHLGSNRPPSFHEETARRSWRLTSRRMRDGKPSTYRRKSSGATKVSEARSQKGAVGRKRPRFDSQCASSLARRHEDTAKCVRLRSAEAVSDVVKHPVPRSTPRSQRVHGDPHASGVERRARG